MQYATGGSSPSQRLKVVIVMIKSENISIMIKTGHLLVLLLVAAFYNENVPGNIAAYKQQSRGVRTCRRKTLRGFLKNSGQMKN